MPGDVYASTYDDLDPNLESQRDTQRGDAANQASLADLNQALARDPRIRAFLLQMGNDLSSDENRQALTRYVQALGYAIPSNTEITERGAVEPLNHDLRNRILTAAMLAPLTFPSGGAGATGSTGAAGTGGSGLAGSSYVVPNASLGANGGISGAGGLSGLAGSSYVVPDASLGANGGVSVASKPSLGTRLFNSLVGDTAEERLMTGVNLAANWIQSQQTKRAVQAQVDAAEKARQLYSDMYQQQRTDLAPYRALGNAATKQLAFGMGLTPEDTETLPAFQPPRDAQRSPNGGTVSVPAVNYTGDTAVPRSSLAGLGQTNSGMVTMISPNGQTGQVPRDQVQRALSMGARMA